MRIGILVPDLEGGGAEAVASEWCSGLAQCGHNVVPMLYPASGGSHTAESLLFNSRTSYGRWVRLPRWVATTAKQQRLDAVIAVLTFSNLTAVRALRRTRVKVVITEHTLPTVMLRSEGVAGRLKRFMARRLYRHADAIVAVSHGTAADLVSGFNVRSDRVWVVPNPALGCSTTTSERIAQLPKQPLRLAFVGRLVDAKRPLALIDTAVELAARGVTSKVTYVGDGPLALKIRDYASSSDVTCSTEPWTESWASSLAGFDCIVLPSDVEGFGNVLVQAAAAGIPTVASSQAIGVGDAIVPGVTGVLALSNRPAHLADAILEVMDLRKSDPLKNWLGRFTTESASRRLSTILQAI